MRYRERTPCLNIRLPYRRRDRMKSRYCPLLTALSHISRARGARRPSAFGRQDRPARAAWAAPRLLADVANFFLAESGSGRRWSSGGRGERSIMSPPRRRWCGRRGRAQRGSATGSSTTDRQIRRTSSLSPACVRSGISGWRDRALYPLAGGRRGAERRGEFWSAGPGRFLFAR